LFTHPARLLDASAAATAIWHAISMTLRTGANACGQDGDGLGMTLLANRQ